MSDEKNMREAALVDAQGLAPHLLTALDLIDELYRKYDCALDDADTKIAINARNALIAAIAQPLVVDG